MTFNSQPLRTFQGQAVATQNFGFESFAEILKSRASGTTTFLKVYNRNKKTHEISFQDFATLSLKWAGRLQTQFQIQSGDHVLVLLGTSFEAFLTYSALMSIGAIVVPVDPSETKDYVAKIVRFSGAKLILTFESSLEKVQAFREKTLCVSEGVDWAEELKGSSPAQVQSHKDVALFFTSGTTGDPKGVLLSLKSILSNLVATQKVGNLSHNSILMSCLPIYHVNAFNFSFFLPLFLGCTIIYQRGFFPNLWNIILDEKVEAASLSPLVIRLMNKDSREPQKSSTLRLVISASSALYREDLLGFKEKYGVWVRQAYGLSETVNFTLFTPELDEPLFRDVMLSEDVPSAGSPTWGNDVFLLDEEGREIQSPSTRGELVVRGWNILNEYYKNANATETAFNGSYFHSGDVAYFKEYAGRRFYYLCGRIKDIVKRKGKLIYLAEIDEAIKRAGLENACAVGFKNKFTDEEVGLYAAPTGSPIDLQAVYSKLSEILHPEKMPKVFVEGPEIPKTSVGKIKRRELGQFFANYEQAALEKPIWPR